MQKPILEARNITKTYQMGEVTVHALKNLSIEFYPGEFVVLLGHSGSGKSTLLNILGGLDKATSGEVYFNHQLISEYNENQLTEYRRDSIGFIFQMYNLLPRLTALENVQLVAELANDPMKPEEALMILGMEHRADHFPSQLSGGEQQRISIARAIAKNSPLLFCDEPTGALDFKTGVLVLEALQRVNQEMGATTIVITHNSSIAELADRVIFLKDGQIQNIKVNKEKKSVRDISW
ncbi:ABC transporter ATP-binding protein [Bacteriovoracaceae bacterium]|nr:ABC transporter ATP-binding protein [Bacteriovoracaceae bacterium]